MRALAATGDDTLFTVLNYDPRQFEGCLRPNYYLLVPAGLTGRALATDLFAFFVDHGGFAQGTGVTGPCPAYVYGFHSRAESFAGNGFTAGTAMYDDGVFTYSTGDITSPETNIDH